MQSQKLIQVGVVGILTAGLLALSAQARADETARLQEQVKALQERVDQLESERGLKQPRAAQTPAIVYDQWTDPFTQMALIRQQMERNIRQAQSFADASAFNPRMDIKETPKEYIITMDIPGIDRDKIDVENKDGMLVISGERRSEAKDNKNNNQYYRQERFFGSFMQAIPLPEDAKTDQIEAKYNNGVLTVTVARMKKEEKKPEEYKIMVK